MPYLLYVLSVIKFSCVALLQIFRRILSKRRKIKAAHSKKLFHSKVSAMSIAKTKQNGANKEKTKYTIKYAFKKSLPIMAGYAVLGMGFGVLMTSRGFAWWWSLAMSITIYSGSMQYVAADVMSVGASLISTVMLSIMVNIRYMFYGVSLIEKYKNTGPYKPYLIFALTDETYSVVCSTESDKLDMPKFYFWLSLFNQLYWIIGSTFGAVLGSAVNINTTGVDFSMTALFIIITLEQWEKSENHIPVITGAGVSLFCLLIFGSDNFLVPAMLGITAALFLQKPMITRKDGALQ